MDRKTEKRNKYITLAIFAGVIVLFFVFNFSQDYTKELDGTLIKLDDTSVNVPVKIQIDGKYDLNCFAPDSFKGTVYVSGIGLEKIEGWVTLDYYEGSHISKKGKKQSFFQQRHPVQRQIWNR